jgi:hypothetical protein
MSSFLSSTKPVPPSFKPVPPYKLPIRFAGSSSSLLSQGVSQITHGKVASKIQNWFGHISLEEKPFGLSRQDVTSRVNTGVAVYLPALYFSLVPEKKHFLETNGRNLLIWGVTLGLTLLTKSPKYGINPPLTYLFMNPKNYRPKPGKNSISQLFTQGVKQPLERLSRPFRPDYNYFDLLEHLHPEKKYPPDKRHDAVWSSVNRNSNLKAALQSRFKNIVKVVDKNVIVKNPDQLRTLANHLKVSPERATRVLNDFTSRMTNLTLFGSIINTILTCTVLGIWVMKIVFKYIAPLDPDFTPKDKPTAKSTPASFSSSNKPSPDRDGLLVSRTVTAALPPLLMPTTSHPAHLSPASASVLNAFPSVQPAFYSQANSQKSMPPSAFSSVLSAPGQTPKLMPVSLQPLAKGGEHVLN